MVLTASTNQVIKDLNTNQEMVAWTLSIFALGNGALARFLLASPCALVCPLS
jgi:hypothetical protein